jgi:PST family polysaccharide transporter
MRSAVLRGGATMAVREVLGIVVRLGGIVVLTRVLGPTTFGLYASALAITTVLGIIASLGAEVYLPRSEEEPTIRTYQETTASLLVSGCVVGGVVAAVLLADPHLVPDHRYAAPLAVMALAVPISVARVPARIMLERRFAWGKVAVVDLGGDVCLYLVGVTLALLQFGIWAPVSGYVAWQIWSLVAACCLARYVPRPRWSAAQLRVLARYGLTLSTSTLLNRGEDLVNPLVVGSHLGTRSVGFASFAMRMGETVAFPARASWRLALVAFGQVQGDRARLRRGIEESMALQVLVLGAAFLGFCLIAPLIIPPIFGDRWEPALALFPFVAVRYVVLAVNGPQSSALYVLGAQSAVIRLAAMRATAAVVAALVFVPLCGLEGFGIALLAPTVSLAGFTLSMRKRLPISYREPFLWAFAFLPGCFAHVVGGPYGYLLVLTALPACLSPLGRHRLADYAGHLRAVLARRRPSLA